MNKAKINRAKMIAKCGRFPLTFDENLAKVPTSVVVNCSAKILAEVVDALHDRYWSGYEDAIRNGHPAPVKPSITGEQHG